MDGSRPAPSTIHLVPPPTGFRLESSPNAWRSFDPAGAAGNGLITFTLDGRPWNLPLQPGHKADGAWLELSIDDLNFTAAEAGSPGLR